MRLSFVGDFLPMESEFAIPNRKHRCFLYFGVFDQDNFLNFLRRMATELGMDTTTQIGLREYENASNL